MERNKIECSVLLSSFGEIAVSYSQTEYWKFESGVYTSNHEKYTPRMLRAIIQPKQKISWMRWVLTQGSRVVSIRTVPGILMIGVVDPPLEYT